MPTITHPIERESSVQLREFEASRGRLSEIGRMLMAQLIEIQRKQMKKFLKDHTEYQSISDSKQMPTDNAIYIFWDEMMIERQKLFRTLYRLEQIKGGGEKANHDLIVSRTEICCYLQR